MFLTLTSTAPNATDLGFLLHKHPERVQSFPLSVGTAHVFYPEASAQRCTVAVLLEVDPIGLVQGKRFRGDGSVLAAYVNDRPYAASSMLAVALGRVFSTAMTGRCAARPDLEGVALPLQVHLPSVPSHGGTALVERLFGPLGWQVQASGHALDPQIPQWGTSRYVDLHLTGTLPLDQALTHLYVLLPVLDGSKHYWVSGDEVDKLVRVGGAWLHQHPERDLITRRYLANQRSYVSDATERLAARDDCANEDSANEDPANENLVADVPVTGAPSPLAALRRAAVLGELTRADVHRIVDLGCGQGALLRELIADASFTEIVGVDVSARELARAAKRLNLDRLPDSQRARLTLLQSSVTYRDTRLAGYDAIVLMEVIEHLDSQRLPALERTVFGDAAPRFVVLTTPNAEYNVRFPGLAAGAMRHPDHRFEWTRTEFGRWAKQVARTYGYDVGHLPVGDDDPQVGPPTQMAVFRRSRHE